SSKNPQQQLLQGACHRGYRPLWHLRPHHRQRRRKSTLYKYAAGVEFCEGDVLGPAGCCCARHRLRLLRRHSDDLRCGRFSATGELLGRGPHGAGGSAVAGAGGPRAGLEAFVAGCSPRIQCVGLGESLRALHTARLPRGGGRRRPRPTWKCCAFWTSVISRLCTASPPPAPTFSKPCWPTAKAATARAWLL
ncbi:unnamed protein product, partial [Symbiodinium necroappetens]